MERMFKSWSELIDNGSSQNGNWGWVVVRSWQIWKHFDEKGNKMC